MASESFNLTRLRLFFWLVSEKEGTCLFHQHLAGGWCLFCVPIVKLCNNIRERSEVRFDY